MIDKKKIEALIKATDYKEFAPLQEALLELLAENRLLQARVKELEALAVEFDAVVQLGQMTGALQQKYDQSYTHRDLCNAATAVRGKAASLKLPETPSHD